jgi:hypothetical protein
MIGGGETERKKKEEEMDGGGETERKRKEEEGRGNGWKKITQRKKKDMETKNSCHGKKHVEKAIDERGRIKNAFFRIGRGRRMKA